MNKKEVEKFYRNKTASGMTEAQAAMFVSKYRHEMINKFNNRIDSIGIDISKEKKEELSKFVYSLLMKTTAYTLTAYV